jgi:hypothetical protein
MDANSVAGDVNSPSKRVSLLGSLLRARAPERSLSRPPPPHRSPYSCGARRFLICQLDRTSRRPPDTLVSGYFERNRWINAGVAALTVAALLLLVLSWAQQ